MYVYQIYTPSQRPLIPNRYLVLLTFGSAERLQYNLNVVQFTYGLISPSGSLLRVLLLTLNQSQLLCRTRSLVSYPGDITVYGGPYLYLVLQSLACYAFLVCYDSGWRPHISHLKPSSPAVKDVEKDHSGMSDDVLREEKRTEACEDDLRLLHLRKDFRQETVVDDATFGVGDGEVFALLGPNGVSIILGLTSI